MDTDGKLCNLQNSSNNSKYKLLTYNVRVSQLTELMTSYGGQRRQKHV